MTKIKNNIRRVPSVLQMENTECGAAALAMVLAYHKKHVPLDEVRCNCGVSRDGSKIVNIIKAAQHYHLECTPYKTECDLVFKELELPVILFWGFNHFVVLEGIKNGMVHICDPAYGHRRVTWDEFNHSFTGVALELKPGPGFVTGGETLSLVQTLKKRIDSVKSPLYFALTASLLLVIPGLAIPAFARVFIDNILVAKNTDWLSPLLLMMTGMLVAKGMITWLQQYYLVRMQAKMAASSYCGFIWHMLRLPLSFFTQRYAAEISGRASLNDRLASLMSTQLVSAVLSTVMLLFYFAIMLCYDTTLSMIALTAAIFNLVVLHVYSGKRKEVNLRQMQESSKVSAATMASLQMIETIKSCAEEADAFNRFAGFHAKSLNGLQEVGYYQQIMSVLPEALNFLARGLVLIAGAYHIIDGSLTIGELVAFQMLLEFFLSPLTMLAHFGGSMQDAAACILRLDDVLETPCDPSFSKSADNEANFIGKYPLGKLEFKNVSFGYSPLDEPFIKDLSFVIEPGERLALIGPSACGKSTIAKLAAGLYEPRKGQILIDDLPRDQWPAHLLASTVSMVDQSIYLFAGSVRENLTLWDNSVTEEHYITACSEVGMDEVISSRAGGYEAEVLENGANFSGGQRQRLEIARALISNPRLLLLDEATSSLDNDAEQLVYKSIIKRGCTCLVIAHRLQSLLEVDKILYLENGQIIEQGSPQELLQQDSYFARSLQLERVE